MARPVCIFSRLAPRHSGRALAVVAHALTISNSKPARGRFHHIRAVSAAVLLADLLDNHVHGLCPWPGLWPTCRYWRAAPVGRHWHLCRFRARLRIHSSLLRSVPSACAEGMDCAARAQIGEGREMKRTANRVGGGGFSPPPHPPRHGG